MSISEKNAEDPRPGLSPEMVEGWRRRIRQHTISNYHFEMGLALAAQNENDAAIQQFQRALTERPDFPLAALKLEHLLGGAGRQAEADQTRRAALALNPHFETDARLAAVLLWEERGNIEAAEEEINEILRLSPGCPDGLHWRAYFTFCRNSQSSDLNVPQLPPLDEGDLKRLLGERYRDFGQTAVCAERLTSGRLAFDAALAYRPDDFLSRLWLGQIFLNTGRFGDGVALLESMIDAPPQEPAQFMYLLIRANLAAGLLNRADALVEKMLGQTPGDPVALSLSGLCAACRNDWAESERRQRQAMDAGPNTVFAVTNLGLALQGLGRLNEAVASHHAALRLKPDNPWALTNLALALTAAGDEAGAREAHRKAADKGRVNLLYEAAQRPWAADGLIRLYEDMGILDRLRV